VTLSEIKKILTEENLQLTKSLGQNFLHDRVQIRRITQAAELTPSDSVLEIGPGLGPLTELLLEQSGQVIAVEKDRRLFDVLQRRWGDRQGLTLIHADVLQYLRLQPRDWRGWKVVSNLPYSVGSSILVALAENPNPPLLMSVTLQWEVVGRLLAGPGTKDYGIFTLLMQGIFQTERSFKIPAGCFFPQPNVDSGCVRLVRRNPVLIAQEEFRQFKQVVKRSFSQRRKKMFKLLRADWPEEALDEAFVQAGISPMARAESVSLEQHIHLSRLLFRWAPIPVNRPSTSSSEEVFDVVNEHDEVVDRKNRAEVHGRGLLHRSVHILVFNAAGKVFLQKRSLRKDRFPGAWDSSASGHLDAGEDYDNAAKRELGEELGWSPRQELERLFKIDACGETDQEFVWVYRCDGEGPFQLNADEIEHGAWFSPDQISNWISSRPLDFSGGFCLLWQRLTAREGLVKH
jgi:16S rRNA (adenine1518-N6/adenine1519-N6)-dimethyltransferase